MKMINQMIYPLINLSIVDEDDQPNDIPFDKPFNS